MQIDFHRSIHHINKPKTRLSTNLPYRICMSIPKSRLQFYDEELVLVNSTMSNEMKGAIKEWASEYLNVDSTGVIAALSGWLMSTVDFLTKI